jgi:hypothetical protein
LWTGSVSRMLRQAQGPDRNHKTQNLNQELSRRGFYPPTSFLRYGVCGASVTLTFLALFSVGEINFAVHRLATVR